MRLIFQYRSDMFSRESDVDAWYPGNWWNIKMGWPANDEGKAVAGVDFFRLVMEKFR